MNNIFVDKDEVLADFIGGACTAHGVLREDLEQYRQGSWEIINALSVLKCVPTMTIAEFWEPIDALGQDFWLNLNPLPWADDLIDVVRCFDPNFQILTSPAESTGCIEAKMIWLEEHFQIPRKRVWVHSEKHWLAAEGRILIDDRPINCEKWAANKGEGILFPSTGNDLGGKLDAVNWVHGKLLLLDD